MSLHVLSHLLHPPVADDPAVDDDEALVGGGAAGDLGRGVGRRQQGLDRHLAAEMAPVSSHQFTLPVHQFSPRHFTPYYTFTDKTGYQKLRPATFDKDQLWVLSELLSKGL